MPGCIPRYVMGVFWVCRASGVAAEQVRLVSGREGWGKNPREQSQTRTPERAPPKCLTHTPCKSPCVPDAHPESGEVCATQLFAQTHTCAHQVGNGTHNEPISQP